MKLKKQKRNQKRNAVKPGMVYHVPQLTTIVKTGRGYLKKKCSKCGEVKSLEDFCKKRAAKDGHAPWCVDCIKEDQKKVQNTETGFLKKRYYDIIARCRVENRKCYFTLDQFLAAFEKHKSIYGMKSAWGPGVDHLEQHLPITRTHEGNGQRGKKGVAKGTKRIASNLSPDRLDSNRGYTLQNLIFIRSDENARKKDTTYEDCKIQIRLHEERFIEMKPY